jgi:hypothetical protein
MSSIRELDTISLRQLYYLLSIDLRNNIAGVLAEQESHSSRIAKQLCDSAIESFGIDLAEDEIERFFIKPLVKYMETLDRTTSRPLQGEYALSLCHLEYRSALELYLTGLAM